MTTTRSPISSASRCGEYQGQTILVSREKGTVGSFISLKTIDPDLDKPTSVKDADNHAVLCQDIAKGCIKTIFYGRY